MELLTVPLLDTIFEILANCEILILDVTVGLLLPQLVNSAELVIVGVFVLDIELVLLWLLIIELETVFVCVLDKLLIPELLTDTEPELLIEFDWVLSKLALTIGLFEDDTVWDIVKLFVLDPTDDWLPDLEPVDETLGELVTFGLLELETVLLIIVDGVDDTEFDFVTIVDFVLIGL